MKTTICTKKKDGSMPLGQGVSSMDGLFRKKEELLDAIKTTYDRIELLGNNIIKAVQDEKDEARAGKKQRKYRSGWRIDRNSIKKNGREIAWIYLSI